MSPNSFSSWALVVTAGGGTVLDWNGDLMLKDMIAVDELTVCYFGYFVGVGMKYFRRMRLM
jgi:hypothetical protein